MSQTLTHFRGIQYTITDSESAECKKKGGRGLEKGCGAA